MDLPSLARDGASHGDRNARVAVVIGRLDRGGTERHLATVLPLLRGHGVEPAIFTLHGGGVLVGALRRDGIEVVEGVNARGLLSLGPMAWRLARRLRVHRPDIVHFYLPEAYLVGSICAAFVPRARRVMSRRSLSDYQRKYPGVRWLERVLHRHTNVVLGNSRAVVSQLAAEGVAPHRLGLIYNGIDVQPLPDAGQREKARRRLGLESGDIAGVTIGNLIPYKGHDILLQSLATLDAPDGGRLVWYCVGRDDGIGAALQRRAVELGVHDRVRWEGEQDDVMPYLHACDLAALPSLEEGFSNALLEKMAAALPIVATDAGGNGEAIGDCGRLVPANDPAALAAALQALVDDERRAEIGMAARERVAREFSLARCVSLYAELYGNLVRGTSPGVPMQARTG